MGVSEKIASLEDGNREIMACIMATQLLARALLLKLSIEEQEALGTSVFKSINAIETNGPQEIKTIARSARNHAKTIFHHLIDNKG